MIRKYLNTLVALLSVVLVMSLVSCDPLKKLEKQEKEEIQNYLSENDTLNFVKQPSGLYYLERVAGTGLSPVKSDSAYVKYTGMFLTGTVFDSNVTSKNLLGVKVDYTNIIEGLNEGIQLMKAGGKSTLLIPSELAYGTNGNYPVISSYTPLLFDVELVKVVQSTGN